MYTSPPYVTVTHDVTTRSLLNVPPHPVSPIVTCIMKGIHWNKVMLRAAVSCRAAAVRTRCGGDASHRSLIIHSQSKQYVRRAASAGVKVHHVELPCSWCVGHVAFQLALWQTPAQCHVRPQHMSKYIAFDSTAFGHNWL